MTLACTAIFLTRSGAAPSSFRVEQHGGKWWFVTPGGEKFLSLGVNVVNTGIRRENYRAEDPQYAAFRYYDNDMAWAQTALNRLRAWNFNTIGGWSDVQRLQIASDQPLPYTIVLNLGGSTGVPWSDIFSTETARHFDELARQQVAPRKNDQHLIGYFIDNELGWWDETIFYHFLRQPSDNSTRRALIETLREHYRGDFALLSRDFDTGAASNFALLEMMERNARLKLRPGGRGREVIDRFVYQIASYYYRLACESIRRYDPQHLILGDRYLGWYSEPVARAAARYLDVVSTNYGADWTDGRIARFYLDSLHRLTGKPILISEFYFCAMENRSGNKNSGGIFPTVQTQRERATSFRLNLSLLASLPYIVGAHWFQYYDEPTHGRPRDGEDYNMGLVDIHDRPYEELTGAAASLDVTAIHDRASALTPASETTVIPTAPAYPESGLRVWDKQRAFVPISASGAQSTPFADLYACWDESNLYLAAYTTAYAEAKLHSGGVIPETERMVLNINQRDERTRLRIRFGPGGEAKISGGQVSIREWRHSTRYTVLARLPASFFTRKRLHAGDELQLRAVLVRRDKRLEWNRRLRLEAR